VGYLIFEFSVSNRHHLACTILQSISIALPYVNGSTEPKSDRDGDLGPGLVMSSCSKTIVRLVGPLLDPFISGGLVISKYERGDHITADRPEHKKNILDTSFRLPNRYYSITGSLCVSGPSSVLIMSLFRLRQLHLCVFFLRFSLSF